jgi:hypothetical protein
MKLDIGYSYVEEGSATIEIDTNDYLQWARSRSYNISKTDEEILTNESLIRIYLEMHLGLDKVSHLAGWGQEITNVWDVDILND